MSVQRFRSTTPQSTEAVSEVVTSTTESIEPSKIGDEKVDNITTSPLTSTLPWIGSSSTPNDDILPVETEAGRTEETETERAILSTTSESSSTIDSVKLVEDSATEILLTTAPASLSTLSIPNTRISTASVSQPRPFGFNRRNRPSSTEPTTTTTTTTPLPPSNDQTRSKVSIPSRNNTRSSLLVGRGRLRPRQKHGRNVENSHDDEGDEGTRTRARPSSRIRGASRYTPPTFKLRNESSTSSDSTVQGERVRATTEPPLNTEGGSSRRRFRRPASKTSTTITTTTTTTESTRANELEDSPIVRIVQAYPRRSLPSRSRNAVKEDGDSEKITNIKVLKTPVGQVNRDVYARTRYTRKRNNVSTPDVSSSPPPSFLDRSTTDAAVTVPLTTTTERPILNSIDELSIETTTRTTITTQETSATDLETSTVEPRTTESTMENEVITEVTDDHRTEGLDATTIEVDDEIVDANVIKTANNISETINEENAVHPRRRKVLLRRRPVTTTQISVERENRPHTRRRKVIKRLRPVQNATSTMMDVVPSTEQILLVSTVTPEEGEEVSTTTDASTENLATAVTVAETVDFAMTLETPTTVESVLGDDASSFDFDPVTMASTIIDNVTAIASESTTEEWTVTETDPVESTPSKFSNDILDEKFTNESPTIVSWPSSTLSSQSDRRLEAYNRTYYLDSRYVRRKFVGRRPVVPSSPENFNDRNSIVETSSYSSASGKNKLEGVSKRRKNLFVRRRPVSSSTSRTTIDEDDEEREPRLDTEEVTSRSDGETSYPTTPPIDQELEELSSRYTTTPSIIEKLSSPLASRSRNATLDEGTSSILENEDRTLGSIPSTGDRSPEIRPRYRVPVFIKKTLSTENVYPLDSNESEEADDPRSRHQNFRQPRTRYKYREIRRNRESEDESIPDATQSPSYDSSTQVRTRFYARRPPVSTTEAPVTETLIPAKKFDYAADAHRRQQQSLRTTTSRNRNEDSTTLTNSNEERAEIRNLVEEDYTTTPSPQPLITRLVTSVEESGTTERQKILIKTKYSSLTSTTKIPLQATLVPLEHPSIVTSSSIPGITLERSDEDESMNEIRQSHVERSTLPIESEFLYPSRFTTESHESSTIEIESVFSNLIGNRDSAK